MIIRGPPPVFLFNLCRRIKRAKEWVNDEHLPSTLLLNLPMTDGVLSGEQGTPFQPEEEWWWLAVPC